MNHNITIQPADTPEAEARFRHQLTLYFRQDIFPGESPETALPPGYWQNIDALHRRAENPLHYLFFRRDGVEIGIDHDRPLPEPKTRNSLSLSFASTPPSGATGPGPLVRRRCCNGAANEGPPFLN